MNSSMTLCLRRGAILGLALLVCVPALAQDNSRLLRELLRDTLRGQSYMIIETDGAVEVIILGDAADAARVQTIGPAEKEDALYELVDSDPMYAVGKLHLALDDPSRRVSTTAIRLLGEIDTTESRMVLEGLLTHPDAELRLEMVEAIADARGSGELLRKASEDTSTIVADAASEYLHERIDGRLP